MRTTRPSPRCWLVAAIFCLLAADAACCAETTIQDIIENVRRNEALYDNVDVTMDYAYELAGRAMPTMPNGSIAGRTSIVTHYVSQDGMFRLHAEGESQTAEGPRTEDRIRAFDGETTRLYEQHAVGNIITGRAEDDRRIQPHILLVRHQIEARVPLSLFLSGHDAVRAHPLNHLSDDDELVASYEGTTEFQGVLCHKVATVISTAGELICRNDILLAEERNYLPIKVLSYTFRWSNDLPIGEATATDLKEIAPGIWYPFAARITSFNPFALRDKGVQKVIWTEDYTCQSVSLEPNYPDSYFSDMTFPGGTAVYRIQDGKITSAYRQGLPEALQASPRVSWQRWGLWATNLLVVLCASFVLVKRSIAARRRVASRPPQSA